MMRPFWAVALSSICYGAPALAVERGEEVEITAGAVTGLSCAVDARKSNDLTKLSSCPLEEARKEIVVFDVAEKQIYRISKKRVFRYELEKAFGGGSVDFTGKVSRIEKKSEIATVDVDEYSVTPKPKPGSFKGCL